MVRQHLFGFGLGTVVADWMNGQGTLLSMELVLLVTALRCLALCLVVPCIPSCTSVVTVGFVFVSMGRYVLVDTWESTL